MIDKIKVIVNDSGFTTVAFGFNPYGYQTTLVKKTGYLSKKADDMIISAVINKESSDKVVDIKKDMDILWTPKNKSVIDDREMHSGRISFEYKDIRCSGNLRIIPENFLYTFAHLTKEDAMPLIEMIANTTSDKKNLMNAVKILSMLDPDNKKFTSTSKPKIQEFYENFLYKFRNQKER